MTKHPVINFALDGIVIAFFALMVIWAALWLVKLLVKIYWANEELRNRRRREMDEAGDHSLGQIKNEYRRDVGQRDVGSQSKKL